MAKALVQRGECVEHIHADGRLESHTTAMERLLDITGVPTQDLFCSHEELIAQALAKQEKQIVYVAEERESAPVMLREESR